MQYVSPKRPESVRIFGPDNRTQWLNQERRDGRQRRLVTYIAALKNDAEEGWAPSGCTLSKTHHEMSTHNHTIPGRSPPGSTRTAPSAVHQDGGVKYATGASSKIRVRDNITIGTWNTRTLKAAGKLQELTHEMDRYRWNLLGLCEMRRTSFGKTTTEEGHKVFFSGKEVKHERGVGFLVHKDIVNTVMEWRPVPSRLITIRLRAVPFNITIVQAYAPTSD